MRFGKDKARERLGELTLLEHAVHALQAQAETVIVMGREGAVSLIATRLHTMEPWL